MMDATQVIQDFPYDDEEEDDSGDEEETLPVAKLKVFTNEHVPETELLLYPGENVLGRDAAFCTVPLPAPSMSKRHAIISITVFRSKGQCADEAREALIWDMGSLNGTRKGRLKLKPHVRYALSEGDKVTLADLPCQYVRVGPAEGKNGEVKAGTPDCLVRERGEETRLPQGESHEVNLRTDMGTEADRAVERAVNGERGFLTPRSEQGAAKPRRSQVMPPVPEQKDQTPVPLVPESDSESDGEKEGRRPRAAKCLVSSDSDSPRLPQPACSTFQSPSGAAYIPESPSSSVRGRANETVSSGESIWTDRSTGAAPIKPRPDPLEFNMDSDTDVEGDEENGQTKSPPEAVNEEASAKLVSGIPTAPATNLPDFYMDSDTDAEGDDHETSATNSTKASVSGVSEKPLSPATDAAAAAADAAAAAASEFHFESDTDVEDEDAVPKTVLVDPPPACLVTSSDVTESRPANVASSEFHMDSDTDMEEEGEVPQADVSAAGPSTALVKPEKRQVHDHSDSADTTDEDPFKSDNSKNTEACASQQPKPSPALEIQADSDTDVEDENVRQLVVPSETSGSPHPPGLQPTPEATHGAPDPTAGAAESDQDTDVEEGAAGSVGGKQEVAPANPDDFNMDSDTDVEEEPKEVPGPWKAGSRASTAGIQSSTPVGAGLQLEEMETQLFLSPSDHFTRPIGRPPFNPVVTSEDSPDDDFVPETQSFVTEPEGCGAAGVSALDETAQEETQHFCTGSLTERSTRLRLSLTDRLHQLGTESTQAYTLPKIRDSDEEEDGDLEATQDYGALQATQAFARETVKDEEEALVDSATAETQAFFITTGRSSESVEAMPPAQRDVLQGLAGPEAEEAAEVATQLMESDVCSHTSTADTVILQRSQKLGGEETGRMSDATSPDLVGNATTSEAKQGNVPAAEFYMDSDTDVDEEKDDCLKEVQAESNSPRPTTTQLHSDSDSADTCDDDDDDPYKPGTSTTTVTSTGGANNSCAETQPMSTIDDDEEEEEEPKVAPAKRKGRARRGLWHHGSQPYGTLLIAETQPIAMNDDDGDNKDEASKPASPKRRGRSCRGKGRQAGDESEPSELASSSCLSTAQTQPMANLEEDEEEEPKPAGPIRKGRMRRGRGAQVEDGTERAETQLSSYLSVAETQPISASADEEGCGEGEPRPASSKGKGKQQEEGESEPAEMPSSTHLSTAETQPMTINQEEEEEEDGQPGSSSSRVKTRRAGKEPVVARSTRGRGKAEEERQGEEIDEGTSVELKRQTRSKTPAGKKGGQKRGEEDTEEKPVQEIRRGRGRKSVVQQRGEQEELERLERQKEQQEKKRIEGEQKEQEKKLEREEGERLEKEERERLEREQRQKEEREKKEAEESETLEKERIEKERKEEKEREILEREKREKEEREKKEAEENERLQKERAALAPPSGQGEPKLPSDDCPARRTRSRSSSSNSVSSERSTSSVRSSTSRQGTPEPHNSRRSSRRPSRAPPGGEEPPTLGDGSSESLSGRKSRRPSTSSNSVCSEVSEAVSVASQNKGRGRGRGRGRKSLRGKDPGAEAEPEPAPSEPQVEEASATKTSGQGRRGRKTGAADEVTDSGSTQAKSANIPAKEEVGPASRGRRGVKSSKLDSGATGEGSQTAALEGSSNGDSIHQKTNSRVRGRGQKAGPPSQSTSAEEDSESIDVKSTDVSMATSQGRGKKRGSFKTEELDETEEIRFKIPRSKGKAPKGQKKTEDENNVGAGEPEKKDEEVAPGPVQKKGRGRQKKTELKKEVEESEVSATASTSSTMEQQKESEPEESSENRSRKRDAAASESPTPAKSARRSVSTSRQAYKVLFTGVTDESGEAVVTRLGGSIAKGVSDMTHLVTDAVRRTVKFMCAVARGVPIVTPDWLKKCGRAGSFLPPGEFLVKDVEQERKFNFRLMESLSVACSQPLLQGYEIHVTRSVKPEPTQMKDIITSSGARYLPRMPSVNKPQTVVVSCTDDAALCCPAVAACVPVVTSEFLLTGILQQRADVVAHALAIPQAPARGRKKT